MSQSGVTKMEINFLQLRQAANDWSAPVLIRKYEGKAPDNDFQAEAEMLGLRGYFPDAHASDGGHIHAGRLLLTGGLSVFAGRSGIRSKGSVTVTYKRAQGERVDVVVDRWPPTWKPGADSQIRAYRFATDERLDLSGAPQRILNQVPIERAEAVEAWLKPLRADVRIIRPETTTSAAPDPLELLERASRLRDQGVLSDEEFQQEKARILGR